MPGFYSPEQCQELIEEFHRLETQYPDAVQRRSDARLFGANRASFPMRRYAEHAALVSAAKAIYRSPHLSCLTLAARLGFTPNNAGSGEGWHRDSYGMQFKSILYLTDVGLENGPFEILPGSHRFTAMMNDTVRQGIGNKRKRLTPEEVEQIIAANYPSGSDVVTGSAGTVLLVITNAVHRGTPIQAGVRYAVTNYYFNQATLSAQTREHFSPLVPEALNG